MGACLSKKKGSFTTTTTTLAGTKSASATTAPAVFELKKSSVNGFTVSKPKVKAEPDVKQKKENKNVQEKDESVQEDKGQVRKEIFIIKHRKSHDERDRNSKFPPEQNEPESGDKIEPQAEVDAILIHCGRLSRNSSGKAASFGGRFSGSKRSHDFDHCDNDTISTEEDLKKANATDNDWMDAAEKRHRQSPRSLSQEERRRRRRTPSREREEKQRSSSRERRVSRSPVRRSLETNTPANTRNNNNNSNASSKPGKMVSVPATVSSLAMDKSNNNGGGGGGGDTTGIKRITVRRNVGVASPRSQSPARANGNAANGSKVLSENQQQQPSLSRNNSRKAEQSPYRRNPLSEVEPNSLAFPHSTTNNNSSRVQNKPKKEIETEANQKPNASRIALDKGAGVNSKTNGQQEEDVKLHSSMTDNVVMTVIQPGVDNLKSQTLTRSRSSRRSRDLDLNPEALVIPPQSYTSLLLEDIQNFHQKNTPPVSLPACVTRACSILEAVADLNSNSSSNFTGRNDYNVTLGTSTTTNSYGKRVQDTKDPNVEYEMVVYDDVMEPSLHKYVTVNRGSSEMEDQESSGSNSFTVSSGKQWQGISSSSWEPNSTDSKDCWTSRVNNCKEEGQKNQLGLNSKRRESDLQHDSEMGRGRLGGNNVLHTKPVVSAAASTYR